MTAGLRWQMKQACGSGMAGDGMGSRRSVFRRNGAARGAALAVVAALAAGCATTRVDAEWADPAFAGRSLRGAKVLVVCDAADPTVQRLCVDRLSAEVATAGATPVSVPGLTAGPPPANDRSIAAARSAGAAAILAAALAPDAAIVRPGPSIGVGIGGWGGSGGRTVTGGGVGVGVPIGSGSVEQAYAASVSLTDVSTVRPMWSSRVTARASGSLNEQVADLARAAVEAARGAGLL
jgi:hypothetical protein